MSPGEPSTLMDSAISSQCVLSTFSTNALLLQVAQSREVLSVVDRAGVQGYDFVISSGPFTVRLRGCYCRRRWLRAKVK